MYKAEMLLQIEKEKNKYKRDELLNANKGWNHLAILRDMYDF